MEENNNEYDQMFRQEVIQDSAEKIENQKSKKKIFIFSAIAAAVVILVFLVVFLIISNNKETNISIDKTVMMTLYEQLDDEMTYEELTNKVKELDPKASVMYDEGSYIISSEESEDDFITCGIKMDEMAEIEEEENNGDEATSDEVNLEELVENIMNEDESEWDDEVEEEEEIANPYEKIPEIDNATIMTYFVYHFYGEIDVADDGEDIELTELYIQKNKDNGEYDFFNGKDDLHFSTKTLAINELLKIVKR